MAIKSLPRNTEIADSPFRSLQDVEKLLARVKQAAADEDQILRQIEAKFNRKKTTAGPNDWTFNIQRDPSAGGRKSPQIDTHRLNKVVIPKMEDLKSNFSIVDDLQDKVEMLNTLHAQVSVSFRGVRGSDQTLKAIDNLKANVEAKLGRALKFLEGLGKEYAPAPFKTLVEEVVSALPEELSYSDYQTWGYVTENDDTGGLTFTTYIKLINLSDDEGHQYPEFYLVFTCVLTPDVNDKSKMNAAYYVTVMHNFQTPGKFNKGRQFKTAKEALGHVGTLLSIESISNSIGGVPHNLDPGRLTKDKMDNADKIADIKVEPDAITFVFLTNATQADVQKASRTLLSNIQAQLRAKRGDAPNVKAKATRDPGSRRYAVRFTFSHPAKENQLDVHDMEFLKERFGLDDKKMRKVIDIING